MAHDGTEATQCRILLVEDETIIAEDQAFSLANIGYETIGMVSTGEQAVEMTCRLKPDLVLMDIKLKGKWME